MFPDGVCGARTRRGGCCKIRLTVYLCKNGKLRCKFHGGVTRPLAVGPSARVIPYGLVDGELRLYGACDFEIGSKPRVTEPRDEVRGDAARIWLYMVNTYKVKITPAQRKMFEEWSAADPVDAFERLRDTRIEAAQGNRNPHVGQ